MNSHKIKSLQILRAIAFLFIYFSHAGIGCPALASWSVVVFFCLSGFLLVYKYNDKELDISIKSNFIFAFRRIKSIYPLHFVLILFSFLINRPSLYEFKYFLCDVFLIQSWIPNSDYYYAINGVSWFLSSILFSYFLFPYFLKLVKRIKSNKVAIYIIISIFLIMCLAEWLPVAFGYNNESVLTWFLYICPIYRAGYFFLGNMLGGAYINKSETEKLSPFIINIYLLCALLFVYYKSRIIQLPFIGCTIYTPAVLPTIYFFTVNKGIVKILSKSKLLFFIGEISQYLFLIHTFVFNLYFKINTILLYFSKTQLIFINQNKWITALICLLVSMVLSVIWKVIYIKFNKKKS